MEGLQGMKYHSFSPFNFNHQEREADIYSMSSSKIKTKGKPSEKEEDSLGDQACMCTMHNLLLGI